jgi:hypothetical protein
VLELGIGQLAAVERVLAHADLTIAAAKPDLAGIPRALVAKPSP